MLQILVGESVSFIYFRDLGPPLCKTTLVQINPDSKRGHDKVDTEKVGMDSGNHAVAKNQNYYICAPKMP